MTDETQTNNKRKQANQATDSFYTFYSAFVES